MGWHVGYVRVSSLLQNTERQLQDTKLDRLFTDRVSGKSVERPELTECLKCLREGDTLHVHSIDRLARNLKDLQTIVEDLTTKNVSVRFHKENLTFQAGEDANPLQKLMFQMLGAFSEFERNLIRERQAEGIALAKKAGKYKGRKKSFTDDQARELRSRKNAGESITALAKEYGVTRQTIYQSFARLAE